MYVSLANTGYVIKILRSYGNRIMIVLIVRWTIFYVKDRVLNVC